MVHKIRKNIAYIFAALLLCVTTVIGGQGKLSALSVSADTVTSGFDDSPISEDLRDISILRYPKNLSGKYRLVRLTEFCYSERPFLAENFGLYLYVYNPTETELETDYNTVTMATSYNPDGTPAVYDDLNLILLDCTTNHRFYKFRIDNSQTILSMAQSYASRHDGERRYDISDIYLRPSSLEKDADGVSRTYYFSGYAKGCSDETVNESTLSSRYEGLETIELEVNHANYRMENTYKAYTRQEVNSVYFAVPQRYFDEYGGLQKIKSTWYEYKTNPVFVTSDEGAYNALTDYIGVDIGEKNENLKWRVLWEELPAGRDEIIFYGSYNRIFQTIESAGIYYEGDYLSRFDWLFYTEGQSYEGYQVPREKVETYIQTYTNTHPSQTKLAGKYAENLFAESIDEERIQFLDNPADKRGKITQEIDAGDTFDLVQYKNQTFWQRFWGKTPELETTEENISPISIVEPSDLELGKTAFCEKFLISASDYDAVIEYCSDTLSLSGENAAKPVIFHFAINDYYSSTARYDLVAGLGQSGYTLSSPDGYVAQETIFLDYKIISLTFRNNGTDTVVATVSNPLDIINGFDPPDDDRLWNNSNDLIKKIIAIILLLLLIAILSPVLPLIIQAVVWLIALPFKLLGAVFKGIGNFFHKRE